MMEAEQIIPGVKVTYKDATYVVLRVNNIFSKEASDGNWYPSVIYRRDDDNDPVERSTDWYVRRVEDFQKKFSLLNA